MKKLKVLGLMMLVIVSTQAQPDQKDEPLLTAYYAVKDALVSGDGKLASANAAELVKQLDAFSSSMKDDKLKQLINKIKSDAVKISDDAKLDSQRKAFTPLSMNFFEFARMVDLSGTPVYQFYCPMKKAIWLSAEKAVKNPYYGKQMLTCGSLQETLN